VLKFVGSSATVAKELGSPEQMGQRGKKGRFIRPRYVGMYRDRTQMLKNKKIKKINHTINQEINQSIDQSINRNSNPRSQEA